MPAVIVLAGTVAIDGAFPHAVRRLREAFPKIDWREGRGSGGATITLVSDPAMKEGAFRVETGNGMDVRVTGGGVPGVIYAVEDMIARGGTDPSRLAVSP